MDPRQPPQHPFSRNTASPYGRTPFPPSSNQAPFSPSSHPPNAAPAYSDHQRRPSDPPYYNPQRNYGRDEPPLSGSSHSRHQSASSVGHGAPMNRAMPPPSSPQQQAPQQPPHQGYGPPPPRPPPVSVGPPTSFPSGRELPSLPPLGRPPSTGGSSMSISSMLGGPASREAPSSQYASPINTSAPPNSMYPGPTHASPRTTTSDYAPFRRPQTPDHQRSYENRDHRANSAGSPPGVGQYPTPEARRFGTPQTYGQRPPLAEERREPVRVPNPNSAVPPRPNSQPERAFNPPPSRASDNSRPPIHNESVFTRRVDTASRAPEPLRREEPPYQRPGYEDRHNPAYTYAERERQEREAVLQRERDLREREQREREINDRNIQQEYAHQLAQRNTQSAYNRPPEREPREQPAWMRYDAPRTAYEQQVSERPPPQAPPQSTNGYDYPATTGPQYGGRPAYAQSDPRDTRDPRYPPASSMPPQHSSIPDSQYEASIQERQRQAQQERERLERLERLGTTAFAQQALHTGGPQNGSYQPYESPGRRAIEESQQMQQQRSFLGVQEINRKGRVSPLPQAVQGAQGQLGGPGGEPGIKSEFGRMFSGIGSGVGSAMGVPSPVTAGPQSMPFSNSGQLRREDLESLAGQESPIESGGHQIPRTASRGGRRRKLKEEDSKGDDESSTGRRTPSGRGKRAKIHHNHGPHRHHHHHHRPDSLDNTSSPLQSNLTPFKSVKGTVIPSPPGLEGKAVPVHHHHIQRHHHHPPAPPVAKPQVNPIITLRRTTVRSKAVLESVAHLPRNHLGSTPYVSDLKAGGPLSPGRTAPSRRGFSSTPRPLPRFEGVENCTFTVKVPRVYLTPSSREEITRRRSVWGTDVYTDDSDVIAACIHQGWFRGEWPEDVDVSLLDLVLDDVPSNQSEKNIEDILTEPPTSGPLEVPKNYDLHVTILVLPQLEKYASTTRFGLRSREWGGKHDGYQGVHDGLSFMIHSVQWVDGVDGNEARSGVARRKLLADDPVSAGLEAEESLPEILTNGNGNKPNGNGSTSESFERGGDDAPLPINGIGDIKGIGTNSWWKKSNGLPKPGIMDSDKEKEKENEQAREIETVTERMIENANSQVIAGAVEVAGRDGMDMDGDAVKHEREGGEVEMALV